MPLGIQVEVKAFAAGFARKLDDAMARVRVNPFGRRVGRCVRPRAQGQRANTGHQNGAKSFWKRHVHGFCEFIYPILDAAKQPKVKP